MGLQVVQICSGWSQVRCKVGQNSWSRSNSGAAGLETLTLLKCHSPTCYVHTHTHTHTHTQGIAHQGKEDENWLIWKTSWPMAGWIIAPEEDSDLDMGWLGGGGAINKTGLAPLFWSIWRCLAIKVAGGRGGLRTDSRLTSEVSWVGKPD